MVTFDMEDGPSLLDVIDDTSDLFEGSGNGFSWADEFLSNTEEIGANANLNNSAKSSNLVTSSHNSTIVSPSNVSLGTGVYNVVSSTISSSSSSSLPSSSSSTHLPTPLGTGCLQYITTSPQLQTTGQPTLVNSLQSLPPGTQLVQQGNQQFLIKTGGQIQLATQQQLQIQQQILQQQQQARIITSPVFQHPSGASPMPPSQSRTPNQSPVPSVSPMINKSQSTSQAVGFSVAYTMPASSHAVSQFKSSTSPAPNVNILHLPQQHFQLASQGSTGPFQGTVLQMAGGGSAQNIMNPGLLPGQALLNTGQSLVNTQNTVIQNPNIVHVNVAPVLCSNSTQQLHSTQRTNVGSIQTLPGSIPAPFNIQGTLIQTAEGKSILIPSQPIGHHVSIQNIQQLPMTQQPAQTQQISVNQTGQPQGALGSVIRLAPQGTGQEKAAGIQQVIQLNQQGQQVLIQRTPTPVQGQPQNIIVRTLTPSNLIHISQQTRGQNSQVQTLGTQHVSQAAMTTGQTQGLQVIGSPSNSQVKFINQSAGQSSTSSSAGYPVTFNIGGQNVSLQQLSGLQPILGSYNVQLVQSQPSQPTSSPAQVQSSSAHLPQLVQTQQSHLQVHPTSQQQQTDTNQTFLQQVLPSVSAGMASSTNSIITNFPSVLSSSVTFSHASSSSQSNLSNYVAVPPVSQSPQNNSMPTSYPGVIINSSVPRVESVTPVSEDSSIQEAYSNVASTSSYVTLPKTTSYLNTSPQIVYAQESSHTGTSGTLIFTSGISTANSTQVTTTISHSNTAISQVTVASSLHGTPLISVMPSASINRPVNTNSGAVSSLSNSGLISSKLNFPASMTPKPALEAPSGVSALAKIQLNPEASQNLIKIQEEINKLNNQKNMSSADKQMKLQQLQKLKDKTVKKGQIKIGSSGDHVASVTSGQQINQDQYVFRKAATSSTVIQGSSGIGTGNQQNALHMSGGSTIQGSMPTTVAAVGTIQSSAASSNHSLSTLLAQSPVRTTAAVTTPVQPSLIQKLVEQTSPVLTPSTQSTSQTAGNPSMPANSNVPVPTQVKIGNRVLLISLTPQQKEKVESYLSKLTPEQQQTYLQSQHNILARIHQKQHQQMQIKAQVDLQKLKQHQQQLQQQQQTELSATSSSINQKLLMQLNQSQNTGECPGRGLKRPAVEIPRTSLIHQQIRRDQNVALNPDTKKPFKNRDDACRRLIRYHVFQTYGPSHDEFDKFDKQFEQVSVELLQKKERLFQGFRYLLLEESMRTQPSSEVVMLQRMLNQDIKRQIEQEREIAKNNSDEFEPMPSKYLKMEEVASNEQEDMVKSEIKMELDESEMVSSMDVTQPSVPISIKEEPADSDTETEFLQERKVDKLVIKFGTNGANFSSSFKKEKLSEESVASQDSVDSVSPVLREVFEVKEELNDSSESVEENTESVQENNCVSFGKCAKSVAYQSSEPVLQVVNAESNAIQGFNDLEENVDHVNQNYNNNENYLGIDEDAVMDTADNLNPLTNTQDMSDQMPHLFPKLLKKCSADSRNIGRQNMTSVQSDFPSRATSSVQLFKQQTSIELSENSMYYNQTKVNLGGNIQQYSNQFSQETEQGSVYSVNQSPVSAGSNELESAVGSIVDLEDNEGQETGDTGYLSKKVYQPITESLTDSEENSIYSADNSGDKNSSLLTDDGDPQDESVHWVETQMKSDTETDPQVRAQMETAINSILSLNQGAASVESNLFLLGPLGQDNVEFSNQQSYLTSSDQDELEMQYSDHPADSVESVTSDTTVEDDLDAAVRSILM
ncbi:hypothetical protein CHS0354_008211 [Potamilus streckersoni]|uniref:GLTSCR protein conserved domain-containing protein n=1 Tax=Potamilus streckersoni TaxID=2493646 RepID=A0AAE0VKH0_9BIVA|nr:hypothetical protein CHS0354_008211 [Potamilus streckersoni]